MTQAICLWCGGLKFGALTECPQCEEGPPNTEVAMPFTDHYLTEEELRTLGNVIGVLRRVPTCNGVALDERLRLDAFLFFVHRKWPKVGESFDFGSLAPDHLSFLDAIYRSHLDELPGQPDGQLHYSPVVRANWDRAHVGSVQSDDDQWQRYAGGLACRGNTIAADVVQTLKELGEGSIFRRLAAAISQQRPSEASADAIRALKHDAAEYRRQVDVYVKQVRNGWSKRTQWQARYLVGTCDLLTEMLMAAEKIVLHRCRKVRIIEIELARARQEFELARGQFEATFQLVLSPEKIPFKPGD
jgi:hypothetical protein